MRTPLFQPTYCKIAIFLLILSTLSLQIFYHWGVIKRHVQEEENVAHVLADIGIDSTDTWVTHHAQITRETLVKLRENSCKPPILNPFTPNLIHRFKPFLVNCSTYKEFYFRSHVEENGISTLSMIQIKRRVPDRIKCCYEQLRFSKMFPFKPNNPPEDKCIFFSENKTVVPPDTEFLTIKCWKIPNNTDTDVEPTESDKLLKQTPHHNELLFYVPRPTREMLYQKTKQLHKNQFTDPMNVIIFGIDEVSRSNFIRLLQKTFLYLKSDLDAVDLQGFNKMGDATLNNTLALLTGHDFGSIQKNPSWMPRKMKKDSDVFFDDLPFIWKNFSDKGYITSHADDYTSVFSYRFKGFRQQPTDYFLESFIKWYRNPYMARWRKYGSGFCIGNEIGIHLLNDRARKVTAAVKGHPLFQFFWMSRTHENVGYGATVDKSLLETLRYFDSSGVLNKSLVILLSDHGWRTGSLMLNAQVRMENRLSFAFILLPQWFRERYSRAYENLKENQYRLTSPYDIHATLKDMLNPASLLSNEGIGSRKPPGEVNGVSLFRPISKNRSCAEAGIDEEWCACTDYDLFSAKSPAAIQLANFSIDKLNSWTRPFPKCRQYVLDKVMTAEVKRSVGSNIDGSSISKEPTFVGAQQFRLSFSVLPKNHGAQFEVTVFADAKYWKTGGSQWLQMSTEVFRLNRYDSSRCMPIYSLKKICTCKNR